jgi:hypothetical protein
MYVLDLGVRATHHEFGGRVVRGRDWTGGYDTDDEDGHGVISPPSFTLSAVSFTVHIPELLALLREPPLDQHLWPKYSQSRCDPRPIMIILIK